MSHITTGSLNCTVQLAHPDVPTDPGPPPDPPELLDPGPLGPGPLFPGPEGPATIIILRLYYFRNLIVKNDPVILH